MASAQGQATSIKFAILGIGASTLAMCALIWNALTSSSATTVASSEIDQEIRQESRTPASIHYAFEKMAQPEAPAATVAQESAQMQPAESEVAQETSPRIKELWNTIESKPEGAIESIRNNLKTLSENDEMEAISMMNLSLQVRGHDAELSQLALSELLAGGENGPSYRKSEYLASAMHVYLSTTSDTRAAVTGAAQAIASIQDEQKKAALMQVVEVYLPNGKAMVDESLSGPPAVVSEEAENSVSSPESN